ncbi:MAG: DUF3800 domain-containing protein [Chloroflexi bacterium]|nr:DUF3800 domain-containing protein [Chloroflexota bacterium]
MHFLFVDETGDPGREGSAHFGMALLDIHSDHYAAVRHLLSNYRFLSGMYSEMKNAPQKYIVGLNLLRGLIPMAESGIAEASALYIYKRRYGGKYLTWEKTGVDRESWPYYLRNYVLRHLLEFHFAHHDTPVLGGIDLVLDRVRLSEKQRANTLVYLNNKLPGLSAPFATPAITHLTDADSEYVGGLQLAHILAELLAKLANNSISEVELSEAQFFRVVEFIGLQKQVGERGHPPDDRSPPE